MSSKRPPSRKTRRSPTTKSSTKRERSSKPSARKRKNSDARGRPAARVYLGLGSNVGDRRRNLESALSEIAGLTPLLRVSSFYRSDPVGPVSQREFVNAAAEISWRGTPERLLARLKAIERRLGRVQRVPGGPREIDIDILDLGGRIRTRRDPLLPHPRLSSRRFALTPLAEIAPSWRHPETGQTAAEMMADLPERPGVRRMRRKSRVEN